MTSREIRQKYLDFFKKQGHAVILSASLLPENDPSTLFTSSGMQPLVPYLMGEKHPEGTRLADSQKSFRAEDIEEVGDNRHSTFFEMLGNWSLGDYFKKEQLPWFFEFLTKEVGLDPKRLYVSVYSGNADIGVERDTVSVEIWKEIFKKSGIEARDFEDADKKGMGDGRIFYYGDRKNWWSRSGAPANMPVGEIGGPDSEVFYDLGAELTRHEKSKWKDEPCHVNCDCGRFIEIGNSVFIEFVRTEKGFEPLPQKNVDFGGGLERITMVSQGRDNIFETDLYSGILEKITQLSGGKKYRDNMSSFEVIADHLKAACFIMGDDKGVAPSNTDQGYLVRRLIRRAVRYGKQIGINKDHWTKEAAEIVIEKYRETYPELARNEKFIINNLDEEETKFAKTLNKGLKEFEKMDSGKVTGHDAFNLFQTYGFPLEMFFEELGRNNIKYDKDSVTSEYSREMQKHQDMSRTAAAGKFKGGLADHSEEVTKLHTAAHLMLASLRRVLGDHVHQKGSNITAERLRFDFSHPEKMTDEQKQAVENLVNEAISGAFPVKYEEMTLDEARVYGAEGVFESKYGEKVKVYTVGEGNNIFSKEICGGPHVDNTGSLGKFRIKKEESSGSGTRRIKAVLENQ
ncbi:MAG: alanine--tRNA ligase [Candidatus Falkowbacteria bacterium]